MHEKTFGSCAFLRSNRNFISLIFFQKIYFFGLIILVKLLIFRNATKTIRKIRRDTQNLAGMERRVALKHPEKNLEKNFFDHRLMKFRKSTFPKKHQKKCIILDIVLKLQLNICKFVIIFGPIALKCPVEQLCSLTCVRDLQPKKIDEDRTIFLDLSWSQNKSEKT